ncbi:MAG TPA: hypothetical protein VFB43_09445 [Terracidiphilus sp.]|nr:hypothetical protein [Terracidiphilus sp.]
MNTEYAVGNIRIHFESRARRRWLVALVYAILAVYDFAWVPVQGRDWLIRHAGWFVSGLLILIVALMIVFTWLTDGMRKTGDERETHRREHAYAKAYRPLGLFVVGAFCASVLLQGPNAITPLLPQAMKPLLLQLPLILLVAAGILYFTLPQAVLLWTEPDMDVN